MAIIRGKGTVFKLDVGGILTAVAQVIDGEIGELDPGVYSSQLLNGDPFAQEATGYVTQGDSMVNIFYDPANATHIGICAAASAPASIANLTNLDYSFTMVDTGATEITGVAATVGIGPIAFAQEDGVKAPVKIKNAEIVTLPTS